jgi:hypothetical protein
MKARITLTEREVLEAIAKSITIRGIQPGIDQVKLQIGQGSGGTVQLMGATIEVETR